MADDLESLRARLATLMMQDQEAAPQRPKVIEPLNLEGVASHIKKISSSNDKRKLIVMTGAGISTAAGIPDFRSPGTGLYDNLQKYNLPNPQAIFEIGYFRQNPQPFFHLAKELYPAKFKPTMSHYFIRLLAEEGLLLRNFTQNIDTLERRAGLEGEYIVEAHGAFHNAHCITCSKEYSHDFVKELVFKDKLPFCTEPGCAYTPQDDTEEYRGLIKPDIVFFGEALPERFAICAKQDMLKCELLIIMGTSLVVHPFASLKDMVPEDCPRLLINLEKAGQQDPIMALFGHSGGLDFDEKTAYRDVFHQNTCDEGCLELARLLGLDDKLKALHATEHQRLDTEIAAMEAALAKNQIDEEKTTQGADKSDQSGASKGEGEGVVTTTVIGKPDWGEADKASEKPSEERKTEQQEEEEERKDTASKEKGEEKDTTNKL